MLWAYMAFSQFLIIWLGNLSRRVPGISAGRRRLAVASPSSLIAFHFFLPFFVLLFPREQAARSWLLSDRLAGSW